MYLKKAAFAAFFFGTINHQGMSIYKQIRRARWIPQARRYFMVFFKLRLPN